MKRKVGPGLLICGLGLVGPWGCADNRPRPMDAALFIPPSIQQTANAAEPGSTVATGSTASETPDGVSPKNATVLPSSPHSFDTVQPIEPLQPLPTTMPADAPPPEPASLAITPTTDPSMTGGQGVYMTLGGVLAQVNNTPIYASQVLSPLKREFAAKAREMDADAFREMAEKEIVEQLKKAMDDESTFATLYQGLSEDDRKLAEGITMQIRQERVTAAGGSVERAKKLAEEQGEDFDQAMKQEYRRIVHDLYFRRKVDPLVQVSADNMRDFYRMNLSKLYSEKDRAQFRIIKIDPAIAGSVPAATDKINAIREKAIHGADFTTLASTENDDSFLKGRGGNPCDEGGWMDRDAYRIDAVEAAVWKLEPCQVTPVIEAEGALYIAKLEAKHIGAVRSFDDANVQDDIKGRLRQQQMGDFWAKIMEESVDDSVVSSTDPRVLEDRMKVAVDMAMQMYAAAH